jgi:hypothetical protein
LADKIGRKDILSFWARMGRHPDFCESLLNTFFINADLLDTGHIFLKPEGDMCFRPRPLIMGVGIGYHVALSQNAGVHHVSSKTLIFT